MKVLLENWKKFILSESSLSRVWQHTQEHDTAILTGFRGDPSDTSRCADEPVLDGVEEVKKGKTRQANIRRNRDLKATLLANGYGVTAVDGSYIEDFDTPQEMEVSEDSLFAVNLKDDPSFFSTIETLGKKFCQDSVLMIPQGGKGAYLLGTNNSEYPGLGNKETVGDLKFGGESEFMTRVGGRPFTTNEGLELETYQKLSRNERMTVKSIAKRVLTED
jgi:hypothetical protein